MKDTFGVLDIVDGVPGNLYMARDFEHAVDIAVEIIKASDYPPAKTISEEEIRQELNDDASWVYRKDDIWVYILPADQYRS